MKIEEIREHAFAMPLTNPSYPRAPYRFRNREYIVITYRTDPEALAAVAPEPLEVIDRGWSLKLGTGRARRSHVEKGSARRCAHPAASEHEQGLKDRGRAANSVFHDMRRMRAQ